jgi:hypothetical protein
MEQVLHSHIENKMQSIIQKLIHFFLQKRAPKKYLALLAIKVKFSYSDNRHLCQLYMHWSLGPFIATT